MGAEFGGNGSMEWKITHTETPGSDGHGDFGGGQGTDKIPFEKMRKNAALQPSFLVILRDGVVQTNGPKGFVVVEVPVIQRPGPSPHSPNPNPPWEIQIKWT